MNGARAEPFASTSRPPRTRRKITIGASHHFLRTRRKFKNSLIMASLFIRRKNHRPAITFLRYSTQIRQKWPKSKTVNPRKNGKRGDGPLEQKLDGVVFSFLT